MATKPEAKTVSLTPERKDDADGALDRHKAARPAMTMDEQQKKLRDEEIWGFHCNSCEYDQFSPMLRCSKCGESDIETRQFSTTGKVVSYTIQSVAAEQFMNEVPFAWAIIKLDDGPQISGWIPYISKAAELPKDQRVKFIPSYKPGMMFEKES